MIRSLLTLLRRAFGVVIVPEWRAVHLDEERHLARLLEYLQVDCVFDVGANVGQYGHLLRRYVGYRGRILSFEPNPAAAEQLEREAAADPLWHVERLALGRADGTAEFHSPAGHTDLGSFLRFSSSPHAPRGIADQKLTVPVRTLQSRFEAARNRFGFKRPFLKLDTQGFDMEVVKGAGSVIHDFLGLQSEVAFQQIYEGAPDFHSSVAYYQSLGFVLSRLVPIHECHFPDLVEMDAILVRADMAKRTG